MHTIYQIKGLEVLGFTEELYLNGSTPERVGAKFQLEQNIKLNTAILNTEDYELIEMEIETINIVVLLPAQITEVEIKGTFVFDEK